MTLSRRRQQILDFMRDYWRQHQRAPTVREIQEGLHLSSTSVVNHHLEALAREGYITRERGVSRGIRVVDAPYLRLAEEVNVMVPFCGYITAGQPVPVPDGSVAPDSYLELTREIVGDEKGLFALQVRGDSMVDALVGDGDIVLMKQAQEVLNGDMVAVWLKDSGETTLKKFYREGDLVRLQPANPAYTPIYTHAANVEIQGKVVVVIRQLTRRVA
ncbi:MAG: transcriptional repressor LexA [Anaerolineae bacterium]